MNVRIGGAVSNRLSLLFVILRLAASLSALGDREGVLYTFKGHKNGGWPGAGLTFDTQGNLYGTTRNFGPYGYGIVFELIPSENIWTETTADRCDLKYGAAVMKREIYLGQPPAWYSS